MKIVRSYKLLLKPNRDKLDTARYLIYKFNEYSNIFLGKLYFNNNTFISTKNLGKLANQAQHKAKSIISLLRASEKTTKNKTNVPIVTNLGVPVEYSISTKSSFDYWVRVSNQFFSRGYVEIPAKSHKALNKALKESWTLTKSGEIKLINNNLYLIIHVEKEITSAIPKVKTIGVDIGLNKCITTSYNYKAREIHTIINKTKNKIAERNRQQKKFNQKFRKKDKKSYLKQILDKEAKGVIARCLTEEASLVIESRKVISNLKHGRLEGWARCYFGNRVEVLCKENEIFLVEVNPSYSSKLCYLCNTIGERNKQEFICNNLNCTLYNKIVDSDLNAAYNIMNRGRQVIVGKILPAMMLRLSKTL